MKYVILTATLMIACLASASDSTRMLGCSDASGTIKMNRDEITIKAVTLGGTQEIVLKLSDLNVKAQKRNVLESKTTKASTICNIDSINKRELFTQKITFSKKDGSEIIQDDTPESSPKKITETLLCDEVTIGAWPCK
jgi:hypothetical protein